MPESTVEFGAFVPRWDEYATPDGWRQVARAAEDAGFAWVGRGDRVVFPYREGRPESASRPASELFSVLAYVADETDDIRIGTNICVVPYRHPIHLVKEAFTLDRLTGGRFEFGVGVGWLEDEFEALSVPYTERGSRTDEFLEIYRAACEQGEVSFDGPHHSFDTVGFFPRPEQNGGPPIWSGGSASPAFRRAAEHGVGWTITGRSPADIRTGRERLRAAWEDCDRAGEPEIAVNVNARITDEPVESDEPLVGTTKTVLEGVEEYSKVGATRINLMLNSDPLDGTLDIEERVEQIQRFGDEILPEL